MAYGKTDVNFNSRIKSLQVRGVDSAIVKSWHDPKLRKKLAMKYGLIPNQFPNRCKKCGAKVKNKKYKLCQKCYFMIKRSKNQLS